MEILFQPMEIKKEVDGRGIQVDWIQKSPDGKV